ncbi:DNA repair and recombination protein rhm52 [Golovinomyces cichoracearum]|uniref:RAD52 homolog n=1 Tax=Golovinomyces cichoracearum TaxID=62708 RepID=A0A420HBY4_9PEZI|nr:DNA repair and recombination protein rhm52 [Golovinomyces cichoracearum]
MPGVADHHYGSRGRTGMPDPFQDSRHQVPTYTAQEIATLQSRLEKQLGPEYLSSRSGPGGQKVHYVAAEKCIQLANAVFGFNGWSSQLMDFQVDFVDENPQTLKVSLGLSVVVRVILKDGTFHEDVGYGHIENCKGKAAAFEKAKKEGTTDALKRALRNFGNVLGNCIYDKEYLKQVSKVKPFSPKWREENLFRHESYVFPPGSKEIPSAEKEIVNPKSAVAGQKEVLEAGLLRVGNSKSHLNKSAALLINLDTDEFFEDDFGDFDEADFGVADPDGHPDEVVLSQSTPTAITSLTNSPDLKAGVLSAMSNNNAGASSEPISVQPYSLANGQPAQKRSVSKAVNSSSDTQVKPINSDSNINEDVSCQNKSSKQLSKISNVASRTLNQPNCGNQGLLTTNSSLISQKNLIETPQESEMQDTKLLGNGFYSARAATLLSPATPNPNELRTGLTDSISFQAPPFNPHAESPSIRKTPGIDHRTSKPLTRDLKHVPSASQASVISAVPGTNTPGSIGTRNNPLNTSLDNIRRIGAPGSPSPNSVSNGRGTGFKVPMKRVTDGALGRVKSGINRVPLESLNVNGTITDVIDPKRQKLQS